MSFALYFDEHVDLVVARSLTEAGIDVLTTQEAGRGNGGLSDESQLEFAAKAGRAIFTHNIRDFAPLAVIWATSGRHHAGIVVGELRPPGEVVARVRALVRAYPDGIADLFLHLPSLS